MVNLLARIVGQMLAMFVIIIIFLVVLSSDAFAFQVSPAKITQTEQEQTHDFLVRVDNPGLVTIGFEGSLAEYANANETYVEREATIPVHVNLPELRPGEHDLLVVFTTAVSDGQVGANAQIAPRIRYVERFDGSYIESRADVRNGTQPLKIVTIHENFGEQPGNATVQLKLEDVLIKDEVPVEELERKDYTIEHQKGEYQLTTTLSNGTETTVQNETVRIGNPTITLEELEMTRGDIAVLDAEFDSDWNVPHEEELRTLINNELVATTTITVPGQTQIFWERPQEGNVTVEFQIAEQKLLKELFPDKEDDETRYIAILGLIVLLLAFAIALLFKNKERFK